MSIDMKADDVVNELRAAFAAGIRDTITGVPAAQALQAADALCELWKVTLAGMRITMPTLKFDADAVRADWVAGLSVVEIMRRHGCSRSSAYQYHPRRMKEPGEK